MINDVYLCSSYELAGRTVDPLAGAVEYKGRKRPARRKQLEVLALLASASGKVVPRKTFVELVWGNNVFVGDTGLTDTIYLLRQSLDDLDRDHPLIRTIPRRGYQLGAEARLLEAAPPAFAVDDPMPGKPDWQLRQLLSENAVSQTWLAQGPDATLSVFRFCLDEQHLQMLRRESTLLRYLQQSLGGRADIAHIVDWQLDEPPYFLQLEHFPLGHLSAYARSAGGLVNIAASERLRWMAVIAAALDAVHQVGIVHRNISADCIFLAKDEGRLQPKLGEFGLGELADRTRLTAHQITAAGLTMPGAMVVGHSPYLAPELMRGEAATAASDVYAFGVLLYQVASSDLSRAPASGWEPMIMSLPLQHLIAACLDPETAQRPTAAVIAERLSLVDDIPVVPAQGPPAEVASPSPRNAMNDDPIVARPDAHLEVKAGQTIGPYRVVEKLGQGGMGVVYLAEQREPVQRQVALKVILAGMDTMDVLARFEAERQALAMMNHVNVAAVYEAGSSATGRPYFAMEYVPGLEITAHCDQRELDFRQRIELFLQVCDGVLHAHQKGIIHRDLKPSNIMIKRAQGQPATAKIIDFGVAKSLQRKLGRLTAHTQIGSFVGTPSYSSPEQISGQSAQIDTRTDVYSLGVVLYELLAGVTPYSEEALADQTPLELTEMMRSHVPPPLLKRFVSLEASAEAEIAGRRKVTVAQMKSILGSDLSWIVAKCLEHDPDDRYGSALELKRDLQRWLDDKPLEARPATRWYRWHKLLKRYRTTAAIAAVITLILLGTTTAAIIGYQRAEKALKQTELAAAFQVDQMKAIDPQVIGLGVRRGLFKTVEARLNERGDQAAKAGVAQLEDLLDGVEFTSLITAQLDQQFFKPSLEVIAKQYSEYPALQASLWQSSADTLFELGLYEPALAPQDLAIVKRAELFGQYDQLTLESKARKGRILAALDRTPEAVVILDQTLQEMREHTGLDYPAALDALSARALILSSAGDSKRALEVWQERAERTRRLLGENSPRALYADVMLAGTLSPDRAVPMLENAVAGLRKSLGPDHRDTLDAMQDLSWMLYRQQRMDEAIVLAREVVLARRRLLGEGHPKRVRAEAVLASFLGETRQFRESFPLFRKAIATTEELIGKRGEKTAILRGNYGVALWRSGNLVDAERELRHAADTLRSIYGPDTPGESNYASSLAAVLRDMGRYQESKALYDARIALVTAVNGIRVGLAEAREGLGQMYLTQGKIQHACAEYQAGIDALANTSEAGWEAQLLKIKGAMAYCQHQRDGNQHAIEMLKAVIDQQRHDAKTDVLNLATLLIYQARLLNDEKLWDSALESADEALQIIALALPDGHYITVAASTQKIRALRAVKKEAEATETYQAARHIIDKTPGLDPAHERELTAAMKAAAARL